MSKIRITRREFEQGTRVKLDQRTTLVVTPEAALATIVGRMFDSDKSFPLPRALPALRDVFRFAESLSRAVPTAALVAAHVNQGTADADDLSGERAASMAAWLKADPQPWLNSYGDGVDERKRWGAREDRLMLGQVPDLAPSEVVARAPSPHKSERLRDELVAQYQERRGLSVDGIAGPITRRRLIEDYFALSRPSGNSAATSSGFDELKLDVSSHAAGANFSLADAQRARREALLPNSDENKQTRDPKHAAPSAASLATTKTADARIEFFFFFSKAGIDPAPGAPDGEQYLEWLKLVELEREGHAGGADATTATQLSLRLLDRSGRVSHAEREYSITGPEQFSGTTDADGTLDHDDVLPGDYTLKLTLKFFEGANQVVDTHRCRVIVQPSNSNPQVRMIGAVPRVVLARVRGLLFDTNKAFLLPSAVEDLRDKIRPIYETNNPSELLVVGHTDTTADPWVNDPLSLERAKSTVAYLQDDVDSWLDFYSENLSESRRWGEVEDELMLDAVLSDAEQEEAGGDLVSFFQKSRDLNVGNIDEATRRELIAEYMLLDGAKLNEAKFRIRATAHGCGENFPLDETGEQLDSDPENEKQDVLDRRVELFFFDSEFGIVPPPPGQNSGPRDKQYLEWRKRAELVEEVSPPPLVKGDRFAIRLLDPRGKPMTSEAPIMFDVAVDGQAVASGIAVSAWAIFRMPALVSQVIDLTWGPSESNVRFARRVDLTSALPADQTLSAARLGALGFPVREDGDTSKAAKAYQQLYELSDDEGAVINHMDQVFRSNFEAPHPEQEAEDEGADDPIEPGDLDDDGPDPFLDELSASSTEGSEA